MLDWLRCPFCSGTLSSLKADQIRGEPEYGSLVCDCSRYPVVAGIPVLKKGIIGGDGKSSAEIVALIDAGRCREALLAMIMPPPLDISDAAARWIQSLPSVKARRWLKRLFHHTALSNWRNEAAAFLTTPPDQRNACDILDFYFHRSGLKAASRYDYFAFRFSQPRYLIALSFLNLIQQVEKPILDLACGFGHITRSLLQRTKDQAVIGVEIDFFKLYVAKYWVAPEAEYVCCDGSGLLPFPSEAFSAVICSDALHYMLDKATAIEELKRSTDRDGLIMLIVLRNALLKYPHAGVPLTPEGYRRLVADTPHCLVADSDVLTRYLRKEGPPLARSADIERLAQEPTLSIVASRREAIFRDYGPFDSWSHALGRLELNPLYIEEKQDGLGNVYFRRRFPAPWYEEDNPECKQYLPEVVCINSKTLLDVANGKRTQEAENLIEQCVLLGMPERYR